MNSHDKSDLKFYGAVMSILLGFILCLSLFIMWFSGHANTAWLKKTRGIDIPWYQAAWLDVQINDADVKLKNSQSE